VTIHNLITGDSFEAVTATDATPPDVARLWPLGKLSDLWAADAEAARASRMSGVPRGPVTGFPTLDRELGGYLRPGLHFVHGEPGTGKTNYGLQVAALCGTPALFVSTEMSPLALMRRIVARVTDTYQGHLEGGELTAAASLELFARAVDACPMLALVDATRAYVAPWQMDAKEPAGIRELASFWRDEHHAAQVLVIVDSLHTWAAADPRTAGVSEYESLNLALGDLQRLATALEAPVLVVAERNRPSMTNAGQSSAKGSGRIEYSAESIVSLNRELDNAGEWTHDAGGEYHLFAKVAKNRNGRTGPKVALRFNGALASLREA